MVSFTDNSRRAGIPGPALRVGYVPLTDCAPLMVAHENGLFTKHGVDVHLLPQPGWASIRENLIYRELDAAVCLAGLALALHYGLGCPAHPLVVPLVLSANGNGITLSREIPPEVLAEPGGLKSHLATRRAGRPLTLATDLLYSSHYILLRDWLVRHGLRPDRDAEIVILPPSVIPRNLESGAIDGYCVGEPWNSLAIIGGSGWCAATSVDLANGHPEKVLAARASVQQSRVEEFHALTTALLEACRLCHRKDYRPDLCALLGRSENLDMPETVLRNSLSPKFETGRGAPRDLPDFHLFFGDAVNPPTPDKARWLIAGMRQTGLLEGVRLGDVNDLFRADLYKRALASLPEDS